ncbi:MAG: hypothetical protein DCC52_17970 [Chloroflexi bacterium]|nr:MAG: hypothetical protein DCC52_17970 [Chloroflexota bacterium]
MTQSMSKPENRSSFIFYPLAQTRNLFYIARPTPRLVSCRLRAGQNPRGMCQVYIKLRQNECVTMDQRQKIFLVARARFML